MKQIFKYLRLVASFCLAGVSSGATATPIISELFYDAATTDAGLVFVELFGAPGESLDGLTLEGVNGTGGTVYISVGLSGIVPPDGIFVIGDGSGGVTSVPNADLVAGVDFQNGPDSVVLRNGADILDAVGYGDFGIGDVFAGEGLPAADATAGSSLARLNPFLDNNDNSVDFSILETPTPGIIPAASSVPLPAAMWLFASGLVPLLIPRHGRRARLVQGGGLESAWC